MKIIFYKIKENISNKISSEKLNFDFPIINFQLNKKYENILLVYFRINNNIEYLKFLKNQLKYLQNSNLYLNIQ